MQTSAKQRPQQSTNYEHLSKSKNSSSVTQEAELDTQKSSAVILALYHLMLDYNDLSTSEAEQLLSISRQLHNRRLQALTQKLRSVHSAEWERQFFATDSQAHLQSMASSSDLLASVLISRTNKASTKCGTDQPGTTSTSQHSPI
jgi:hypothetical protein